MVDAQNARSTLKDYWYYNNKVKAELKEHSLYNELLN